MEFCFENFAFRIAVFRSADTLTFADMLTMLTLSGPCDSALKFQNPTFSFSLRHRSFNPIILVLHFLLHLVTGTMVAFAYNTIKRSSFVSSTVPSTFFRKIPCSEIFFCARFPAITNIFSLLFRAHDRLPSQMTCQANTKTRIYGPSKVVFVRTSGLFELASK